MKTSNISLIYQENKKKLLNKCWYFILWLFFNMSNTLICHEIAQTPVPRVLYTYTYATWAATVGCVCRETWAEGAQYLTMEIQCYMLFVTLNCIMGTSMLYCGYAVIVLCVLLRFMVMPPVPVCCVHYQNLFALIKEILTWFLWIWNLKLRCSSCFLNLASSQKSFKSWQKL